MSCFQKNVSILPKFFGRGDEDPYTHVQNYEQKMFGIFGECEALNRMCINYFCLFTI